MAYRDSAFTYIHIDNPNQVLYMEKWQDDPIPFDDIDTHSLLEATSNLFPQLLLEDEEDGGIPISSSTFGAKVYKNRNLLKEKVWTDLGVYDKFLKESSSLHKQTDQTILKPIFTKLSNGYLDTLEDFSRLTINDFLSNGYGSDHTANQLLMSPPDVGPDISGMSSSDYIGPTNNSFVIRQSSTSGPSTTQPILVSQLRVQHGSTLGPQVIQTPRVGRTRQSSTDKNLQTPISRIVR